MKELTGEKLEKELERLKQMRSYEDTYPGMVVCGIDEVVTFSHTAYSKAVFGKGAVEAAKFMAGKKTGYYHMSDVIDG